MPDKKKYKVAIFITSDDNYIDINGNIDGTLPRIWYYIKKELNHKYSFEEKIIYSNKIDFVNFLNKVNSEFDILIGNYWILPERKKIVDFTDTILYNSASILYDKDVENRIDMYIFIKKMLKIWSYPILFVIILIFIFSIINYVTKYKKNLYKSFDMNTNLFIASKNDFITSDYKKFNNYVTFMLIFVFLLMLFIVSYTVRETSNIISESRLINKNIKGMKIYIRKGSIEVEKMVKRMGGIPIQVNFPPLSYNLNKFKKKINGFVFDDLDSANIILDNKDRIGISSVISEWLPVGFPINKKHFQLKDDINRLIHKLKIEGKIYSNCKDLYNKTILC
tara:strand:- start:782 stop:1789 length:1008 start_codon:yes stop_codon:yes gene_type:complete